MNKKFKLHVSAVLILFFFAFNCLPALTPCQIINEASTMVIDTSTVEEVWDKFLKHDSCIAVIYIDKSTIKRDEVLAMYHMINAYKYLHIGNKDRLMVESYNNAIKFYEKTKGNARSKLERNGFYDKSLELLDRLSKAKAKIASEDAEIEQNQKIERYRKDKPKKEFEVIENEALNNLPEAAKFCFNSSIEYNLLDKEAGAEFVLTTIFCDEGNINGPDLGLAQIGISSYYENVSDWFFEELILKWCGSNSADREQCLNNISITLEGYTDGYLFDTTKFYPKGAFFIPEGLNFTYTTADGIEKDTVVTKELKDRLNNNMDLGLVRVHIALPSFNKLTNRNIKIKSVLHKEKGSKYRKLVIRIRAPNLFEQDLSAIKDKHLKIAIEKVKILTNLMRKP